MCIMSDGMCSRYSMENVQKMRNMQVIQDRI